MAKDDIIWAASIKGMRKDFDGRWYRAKKNLDQLKNQGGIYADEHRAMIRLYEDILTAIDAHDWQRTNPES